MCMASVHGPCASPVLPPCRCVWPLFWWSQPRGLAFNMTMCVLRTRLAGWERPQLDLARCEMRCSEEELPWSINTLARRGPLSSGGGGATGRAVDRAIDRAKARENARLDD